MAIPSPVPSEEDPYKVPPQSLDAEMSVLGGILIDGVKIEAVGIELLRKGISIIPQTPMLFSGSIKRNLDPFEEESDETLWKILEEVNLKTTVQKVPDASVESSVP